MPRDWLPNSCFATKLNRALSRVRMTCTKQCALAAGCFRARRLCCVVPLAPSRPVLAAPKPLHPKTKGGHSRRTDGDMFNRSSRSEFCRPNVVRPPIYLAIYWKIGRRFWYLNSRSLLDARGAGPADSVGESLVRKQGLGSSVTIVALYAKNRSATSRRATCPAAKAKARKQGTYRLLGDSRLDNPCAGGLAAEGAHRRMRSSNPTSVWAGTFSHTTA